MASSTFFLSVACFVTIYFSVCAVFFIYGLSKWIRFQNHFLITKRFPMVSNAIFLLVVITAITNIIRRWIDYAYTSSRQFENNFIWGLISGIPQASIFTATSLVIYRIVLIYLRYNTSQNDIDSLINKLANTENTSEENITKTRTYRNKYSILFIIYMVIFSFSILLCHTNSNWIKFVSIPWTSIIFVGIFLLIFIKCKHVKEGIGCLQEAYILLVYLFINIMVTMSIPSNVGYMPYIHAIFVPLIALLPLYTSLYYVYKAEQSLNTNDWSNKHNIYKDIFVSQPLQDIDSMSSNNEINNVEINLELSIFDFLKEKNNYKLFASYLSYCFCLETLLFIQNVTIYYQNVHQLNQSDNISDETKMIRRIKFKYLINLNNKYKCMMKDKMKDSLFSDDNKMILYNAAKLIYDEYIVSGSINEINISYECRKQLDFLLADETHLDKFSSFEDFSTLFDTALCEIYQLTLSMYNYRFEQYVDRLKK
eukprot:446485_1